MIAVGCRISNSKKYEWINPYVYHQASSISEASSRFCNGNHWPSYRDSHRSIMCASQGGPCKIRFSHRRENVHLPSERSSTLTYWMNSVGHNSISSKDSKFFSILTWCNPTLVDFQSCSSSDKVPSISGSFAVVPVSWCHLHCNSYCFAIRLSLIANNS